MISVRPRRATAFALALGLSTFVGERARAQSGTITINVGAASNASVGPNRVFTVPVIADMTGASGLKLASLTSKLTWTPTRVRLDSIRGAALSNAASTIGSGTATMSFFDATGVATTATVANLYFTARDSTVGSRIQITPTLAGNDVSGTITDRLRTRNFDVCVAPQLPWGDANGDGEVNIIDAQQIARFAAHMSVSNPASMSAGDVNNDGNVDIVDAQQTARFSIALSVDPLSRLGTAASDVPEITSIVVAPASLNVGVGQKVQLLATPKDVNGVDLIGCTSVGWSSGNATAATIDGNGVVSGAATGTSTITATASAGVGVSGTMSVTITEPVATVTLTPDTATIHITDQLQLHATPLAASTTPLTADVTYESSDPLIATVSSGGLVTAVNVGPVTITATSEGKTARTDLQIAPLAENSLATGDDFSCALTVTGAAHCWGSDSTFQLGDGRTTNRTTPVAVAVPAALRFVNIIAGEKGVCALATNQSVYCWGSKFPAGAFINPSLVSDTLHVKSIAGWGAGQDGGLCMLNVAGTVYCVGDGDRAQMGTGSFLPNSSPKAVQGGITFQTITSGLYTVCGLSGGTGYCWGSNQWGSLGTGAAIGALSSATGVPNPVQMPGGLALTSIVAGRTLTCGIASDAKTYCWGAGFYGGDARGVQTTTPQPTPSQISQTGLPFTKVWGQIGTRDVSPSCGLLGDGTAYCWGANSSGQLGTSGVLPQTCGTSPTFPCTATPTAVNTASKFVTIRPGGEHTCGITTDHKLLCWGKNGTGQLGDGSTTDRPSPVIVSGNLRVP